MEKYSNVDPHNCSIEELKAEVERLKDMTDFYESKQLAIKKFINSVYGATASPYFVAHNVKVAEAITTQGQDLNHFSENCINRYFTGIFQNDAELHKKLGIDHEKAMKVDISKGKLTQTPPCTGDDFWYLENPNTLTVAGDTDSVFGESLIEICDLRMPVNYWFDHYFNRTKDYKKTTNGATVVNLKPFGITTKALDASRGEVVDQQINYIMKHKVNKRCFKITSRNNSSIRVTEDHSCMVYRDGKVISVKPAEMQKTDKLVIIHHKKK